MQKRERLEKCIAGEVLDHNPVALWRHFPGDDLRATDLARAIIQYQRQFDWDFSLIMPSPNYSVTNYGLQDGWNGNPWGKRKISARPIQRSLDWTELRVQDPMRGDPGRVLECVQRVSDVFEADKTPFLVAVYSPFSQARRLAGRAALMRTLRMHPDRVRTGLNALTESTLRFTEALRKTRIAGLCYIVEEANYHRMSEVEYQAFGLPFDQRVIESVSDRLWFNMISLQGPAPMFRLFAPMPVQAIHWDDTIGRPELDRGQSQFKGAVVGGLSPREHLLYGTPATLRDVVRQALRRTESRRFILSAGGPLSLTTPLSHLQAVRDAVQQAV
jgi:uroporphyrinogen decarboxylase